MAATLNELLIEIQTLSEKLECIGFGGEEELVTHNSVTRPSLKKAISDQFVTLQSMVRGRKTYETKAFLDAAPEPTAAADLSFHLAEVWNDSVVENNGVYGYTGAVWQKSTHELFSFDARLADKVEVEDFNRIAPMGRNLFNANDADVTAERYVVSSSGALAIPSGSPSDYSATGYIAVVPGEQYVRSMSAQMAFYDEGKSYVSGRSSLPNPRESESFVVPSGCYFARFSIGSGYSDSFQVEIGEEPTEYEKYGNKIDLSVLPPNSVGSFNLVDDSVTPDKASFITPLKNMFNLGAEDNVLGSYVNSSNGNVYSTSAYNTTGFIRVVTAERYTVSYSHQRAFYGSNGVYVSGDASGSSATFTVPDGCTYVRFTVRPDMWERFQLELGMLSTSFENYGYRIPSVFLPEPEVKSSRVDQFTTAEGAPKINPYRPELLRHTHLKLMKRALPVPEDAQLVINVGGDSYSHNRDRWVQAFTDYLVSRYGDAGGGWCGFGFLAASSVGPWTAQNQPKFLNGNARSEYHTQLFGSVAGTYYVGGSPDLAFAILTEPASYIAQSIPAAPHHESCDLVYIGTESGVARYSWDDGQTWVTVNVQGVVGDTQVLEIGGGMPATSGALIIEWVAGIVKLCGVNLKSSSAGVRVNKLAATGSNIRVWATAPDAQFEYALAALDADLFIYLDGTNSQGAGISANLWGGYLDELFDRVRAASPGIDVLFLTPPENQRVGNSVSMSDYSQEARNRALVRRFAFNDTQDAFGDASDPAEYGSAGDVPLFSVDLIHPEPSSGGRALLADILKCVDR